MYGTTDRLVVPSFRTVDGTPVDLVLRRTGHDQLAINAQGIAADVTRCATSAVGLDENPPGAAIAGIKSELTAYDAARFKPIRLTGLTCGDNCYIDYIAQTDGAGDEQALCSAPECEAWINAGQLPKGFMNITVGALFTLGTQVDNSGNIMSTDFPAVTAFGPPDVGAPTHDLPLPPGTYVDTQDPCDAAANAAMRTFTGAGISGSGTRDCILYLPEHSGKTYRGIQTCTDTDSGTSGTTPLTLTLDGNLAFTMNEGPDHTQSLRFCDGD